ncbi:MAG: radical SAM protein [Syntrophaceae bacterium]|nr:radical SAM protein [Syntrophaceae bacterium]
MRLDFLLVVPIGKSHYIVPPVGLGYLATALRGAGFKSVAILDSIKENLGNLKFLDRIKTIAPKVVGFQVFSSDVSSVKTCIRIVKEIVPDSVVIIGGPHVSARGIQSLRDFPDADFGFQGEAEIGLPLFARRVLKSEEIPFEKIPGLIYRDKSEIRATDRVFVEDLDSLGFPAWDLMPPSSYPDAPQGAFYEKFPIAPIASSRGCPYTCAFCGSPVNMGNRLRLRSLQSVLSEMELLYVKYGVREFHFIDDMFNASKKRVVEFCQKLAEKNWDISYTFPNGLRLNTLDKESLTWMKKTGAYAFTVGIESGSQRILDAMNKKLTLELIREKVNLIAEVGIEPSGFFLIGFPGETKVDMEKTLAFAKSLPLKRAHFSNFLPLPGTEATARLIESGEISEPNWEDLAYSHTPYSPEGITKNELKAFQRRAFLEFHLRPKILFKMLGEIKSFHHLKSILVRAKDYLFS